MIHKSYSIKSGQKRLLWRLYPSYLLIIFVSLAASGWYIADTMRIFFLEQMANGLEDRARLVEAQIGVCLSLADKEEVNRFCKKINMFSKTRITVILPNGRVIGDSDNDPARMDNHADRAEFIQALSGKTGVSIRYSKTLDKNMMYVAIPILCRDLDGGSSGYSSVIRTSLSIASIDENFRRIANRILYGSLLIAGFAALVSWIMARSIVKPVDELKKGAEEFAKGNFEYKIRIRDSKEITSLANAMNKMAEQLGEQIKTVKRQRNEMSSVLSSMTEGVIALDLEQRIISANPAVCRMLQRDESEIKEKSLIEVVRNTELQRFVERSLAGGKSEEGDVILYQYGEQIMNMCSTPLYDEADRNIGTLLVLNDVTQVRMLKKMQQDLVLNVSHEIKTPLTAIMGFVETLHDVEDPQEVRRFIGIIEKHVHRLADVIENMTILSNIEQENKKIALEHNRIQDVILSAIRMCEEKAGEKQIEINLSSDQTIFASINPQLLQHAFVNLIDNAIKYSKENSRIDISAIQSDTEVMIFFEDYGIGIENRHLSKIFERFYRVDKDRSRKKGGTGLGLAIVKHIVQAHRGTVTAESAVGKGSKFTVTLPKK